MTELEKQLLTALDRLSMQYKQDMKRIETHMDALSEQLISLSAQNEILTDRYNEVIELLLEE